MEINKKKYQSEVSKKQIIDAVIHLLAHNGYGLTSIADISQLTGLTKGALYHHFANKDKIFEEAIRFISDNLKKSLIEDFPSEKSCVEQLGILFERFIDTFESNKEALLILYSLVLEMEDGRAAFAKPLIEVSDALSTFIEKIISKGQANKEISSQYNAKLVSLNLAGMLFGSIIPWIRNRDRTNFRVIMQSQKELFLNAIS